MFEKQIGVNKWLLRSHIQHISSFTKFFWITSIKEILSYYFKKHYTAFANTVSAKMYASTKIRPSKPLKLLFKQLTLF